MPKTKFERIIFAFLSVVITVTLFVFYNISLERGGMSNSVFKDSLNVFFIEFVFAFFLQIFIAGPFGFMSISWTQFFSFFTNIFSQIL